MNSKSLDIGSKVATIKLEGDFDRHHEIPRLKATAIYVLAGGYNSHGRGVDIVKYEAIKKRFDQAVSDMAYELKIA